MAPDPIQCSAPDCNHNFGTATGGALERLIDLHARTAHPPEAPPQANNVKAEKVRRPSITSQGTTEDWTYFKSRWEEYKAATKLAGEDLVYQLLETCEESLRKDLTRCYGTLVGETEANVLNFIKILAIRPENAMVNRVKLQNLHQERDEPMRSFVARLRGQAGACTFTKTKRCQCGQDVIVDFSEDMVRDSLVRGLEDEDIRLHLLGQANQDMTLEETLQLAEAQECGRRSASRLIQPAEPQATANATSNYNRRRNNAQVQQRNNTQPMQNPQPNQQRTNTQPNHNPQSYQQSNQRNNQSSNKNSSARCSHCGQQGHGNGRSYHTRMKNCAAFNHQCAKCSRLHHFESSCRASQLPAQQYPASAINQDAVFQEFNNAGFFDAASSDPLCATYDS